MLDKDNETMYNTLYDTELDIPLENMRMNAIERPVNLV